MKKTVSYKDAGVDISKGNRLKKEITKIVRGTFQKEVLTDIGGFGGLYAFNARRYKQPVLVSSADGVGTKLKVACMMGKHDTVGIDIVSHCANDIVVQGAQALFFLDYIGTGRLEGKVYLQVLKGLAEGCRRVGCSLIGGETAEMPGMYGHGEYDLVGTIIGAVERSKIVDGSRIRPGDAVIGLPSNGLHTNGYSLARKLFFDIKKYRVTTRIKELGTTLGEALLMPHRDYSRTVLKLIEKFDIRGIAHITGGGLIDNIPRILPDNVDVMIRKGSWDVLPIFRIMEREGNIPAHELYRTFNMGVGMVLIVPPAQVSRIMAALKKTGEDARVVGEIVKGKRVVKIV
ncbi:MAG TPA: phosphoribosylformylglycinamidine cyclo-ligase [bacterium]|nr:phosphoribosylformylglycinamidine cyclo-ligase [bacterium]